MTELLSDIETPSDAELISRVRGGDVAAYGELFSRHVAAANRLGRQLARGPDVDDLVSEAFAKVLQVLQGGGGPDVAFRAYLLTAVRRLHVDRVRASSKLQTSDDMSQFDPGIPFQDTAVADFENGAAAKAFASLPERWQLVLWHLEVEGQKPADIAPLLGMSANSVSALAYRAREGLRQAFLTMHLADISADDCRWVNEHLGAYVRKGLSRRDSTKVESHLDECRRCMAMYLELTEVNSNLAGIIAPLLLGAAAASYCASTGTTAGITGVSALIGRARDFVAANAGASTAGAVAAGVAAVATAGVMVLGPDTARVISADKPITETTSLPNSALPPAVEPPAAEPPVEIEERTTVDRDETSGEETADVAGDALDEQPVTLNDPALDAPDTAPGDVGGEPDSGSADQPATQPGSGSGDAPGPDSPGQDGPGGPGADGPGTDDPDEPGPDGPGAEEPGTDEPGAGQPPGGEPPPTNPGPGPEENPGSDPAPNPDEDNDPDGEETPDSGAGNPPAEDGDNDTPSDGNETPPGDSDDGTDDEDETPGGNEPPPSDEDSGPVNLAVSASGSVTFDEQNGANVTVLIEVAGMPADTHSVELTVTANETDLVSVDGCAVTGSTVMCPFGTGPFTLQLRLPPGLSGDGEEIKIVVRALDDDGSVLGVGEGTDLVDTSPPTDKGGRDGGQQDPKGANPSPVAPEGSSDGNVVEQVVNTAADLL